MPTQTAELMHDLRMPLQVIYSCAQLLEEEVGGNARARGYVQALLSGAAEMQQMLAGALEASRPEAGEARFAREDLVSQTWELCARCQLCAGRKGIRLGFHANADRLELALDAEKYSRIVMNLLQNAMKFTPQGGRVRVEVRAMGDRAEVCVADNGCGIAPERLASIFEPHCSDGGYGYGLAIARAYARQLGGTLDVRSEPMRGSAFTLRLPVRSVEAARRATESAALA